MKATTILTRGLAAGACLIAPAVAAAQDDPGFRTYMTQVRGRALAAGVSAATVDAVLPALSLIHISEPTSRTPNPYAALCLKKTTS